MLDDVHRVAQDAEGVGDIHGAFARDVGQYKTPKLFKYYLMHALATENLCP